MIVLRPHQERAINDVRAAFRRVKRVCLVAPTGFGKTAVASALIAWAVTKGRRVLFLVHRREIVKDTHRRLVAAGVSCGLVMADEPTTEAPVQVASVQTVASRRTHPPAELIVWDECFPAGTLVDGRPIESLSVGNTVDAFDVALGAVVARPVTHAFKSRPSALVRLWLDDGTTIVATPGHPFYVGDGRYENAASLAGRDVFRLRNHARSGRAEKDVLGTVPGAGELAHDDEHQPQGRGREDDSAQPDAPSGGAGEGVGLAASGQAHATDSWGQRDAAADRAGGDSGGSGAGGRGGRVHRAHGRMEGSRRASEPLQDRRGPPGPHGRGGDRRAESLCSGEKGAGRAEGSVLERTRVDRVEVLEPGRDGTFGGLCRDGHVYNLEVAGLNNYFVGGVLVHNCHHVAATTYREIAAKYPNTWHLGLTATPERSDGQGLRDAFDEMVVGATVAELQTAVDPSTGFPYLAGLDVIAPPGRQESGALAEEPVAAWRKHGAPRATVAFCRSVAESRALAARFEAEGIAARHVDGEMPVATRVAALDAFARGDVTVLTNVFVLTEGWDCPRAKVVLLARGCGSAATFLQMVGRGLRAFNGERCTLIDLGGVVHEHGMPDEERDYTLDGIRRRPKKKRPWLRQCSSCGFVVLGVKSGRRCSRCDAAWPQQAPSEVSKVGVVRVTKLQLPSRAELRATYEELLREADERGYRPGWAGYKFKDKFGFWPRGFAT